MRSKDKEKEKQRSINAGLTNIRRWQWCRCDVM